MGAAALPAAVGLQAGGGLYSAYAQGQEGKIAQSYYGNLAATARTNAGLAEAAGKSEAESIGYQTFEQERRLSDSVRDTLGKQKASVVNGVGGSSRSAQDIISDTMNKGNLDEMAIRYNAALKIKQATLGASFSTLNYRTQAGGYELAGSNARQASGMNQIGTILGTGGSVASNWYRNYYTG